ncbi:MAG: hypothetical protein GEV11_10765 [Streptosporangiales bacterium]|nr:hypothetical protein [Streptosporangiales bacterium]
MSTASHAEDRDGAHADQSAAPQVGAVAMSGVDEVGEHDRDHHAEHDVEAGVRLPVRRVEAEQAWPPFGHAVERGAGQCLEPDAVLDELVHQAQQQQAGPPAAGAAPDLPDHQHARAVHRDQERQQPDHPDGDRAERQLGAHSLRARSPAG